MKENIKELKKWLFHWLWILIILSVWWLAFWLVKSRTATDPGLGDNGSSLYTSVNETLTAAKRNSMVKSTRRENVATSDTANFDTGCERRVSSDAQPWGTRYFTNNRSTTIYFKTDNTLRRGIQSTSKWTIQVWNWSVFSSPTTVRVLQKKCQ